MEVPKAGKSQGLLTSIFPALHERIETQMDDMINNKMDIPNWMATGKPNWMTTGKPILCQKDPGKGNVADNCQPIFCLPFM